MSTEALICLHRAAFDGRTTAIRRLVAAGAHPNDPDEKGRTALHWATALPGKRSALAVGVLLRRGGNPFQPDGSGRTPEDWAVARNNRPALRSIHKAGSIDRGRALANGFTLVETLFCAAAASLLSAGALGFYGHVQAAAQLQATEDAVSNIVAAAARSYAASGDFRNLTTASAVAEGWLPMEVRTGAGPVNGFGNPIALGHADGFKPNGAMTLTQDLPSSACPLLVATLGRDFNAVIVGGQNVDPAALEDVATLCAAGDTVTVELQRWK